ncbi:MAG: flagellar hook-length control protein FliK [Ruegeria sp.]
MPNPLTLMTATQSTGAKTDSIQGKERETEGGFAFEEVLKEDVEPQEVKDALVAATDLEVSTEQSNSGSTTSVEAPEMEKPHESEPTHPHAGLRVPPIEVDDRGDVTVDKTSANAAPADPIQQVSSLSTENLVQKDIGTIRTTVAPTTVESLPHIPGPNQKTDSGLSPIAGQILVSAAMSSASATGLDSKPPLRRVETEVRVALHTNESAINQTTQQAVISAAFKTQVPTQTIGWTPDESTVDTTIGPEPDDISTLRDLSSGHTLRDTIPTTPISTARAETARAVAGQLAAVVSARPGTGGVEIALNPEELGRVSITLNSREDGFHLTIAAERHETLDLMRRHIAILSAEFEKLGYGDLSLDLGMSGEAPEQGDHSEPDPALDSAELAGAIDHTAPTIPTGPDRGLDMRL